ncbi:hypothetical protein GCM10022419_112580 [Nonomuraea rosea]|uniref:Uncharacterized protein n=1 Tax=Nonomuraea rosea TaxID=638574 RepID=A0ABP6ZGK1_9ACTN
MTPRSRIAPLTCSGSAPPDPVTAGGADSSAATLVARAGLREVGVDLALFMQRPLRTRSPVTRSAATPHRRLQADGSAGQEPDSFGRMTGCVSPTETARLPSGGAEGIGDLAS